ncbi:MAG: hypothetical protein HY043_17560 [Verrucomicrobia bacterium]|nr:hypothetical protein [Verrucomicrobiota bacterium]
MICVSACSFSNCKISNLPWLPWHVCLPDNHDKDNSNKTPLGTHERFIGFLIEHYAGNFPLWLAPDQVRVITLNDDEALINYAQPIVAELRANMVRVDADFSATPFKAKISNAEQLRLHHGGPQGAKPNGEVIVDILASIKERRA